MGDVPYDNNIAMWAVIFVVRERRNVMDILVIGPTFEIYQLDEQRFHAQLTRAYAHLFLLPGAEDPYGLNCNLTLHHAVNGRAVAQLQEGLGAKAADRVRVSLFITDATPFRSTFQMATWTITAVSGPARGAIMTFPDRVLTELRSWPYPERCSLEAWLQRSGQEKIELQSRRRPRCILAPQDRCERRFVLKELLTLGLLPDLLFQLFLHTHPELDTLPKHLLRLPASKRG